MNDSRQTGRLCDSFDRDIRTYVALLQDIDAAQRHTVRYSPSIQERLDEGTNSVVSACRILEQEMGGDNERIADAYDSTGYDWFLDWKFVQRTEPEVLNLLDQIGINGDAVTTSRDQSGIILFCVITRR
ncbi:MAG: hypothetical protein R6U38_01030 [Desulfatiglandaceae bacterium]